MTNKSYSFAAFMNNSKVAPPQVPTNSNAAPATKGASPKQIDTYLGLCARKRITPKDITKFSFQQMFNEIAELTKQPDAASDAQITKIKQMVQEIIDLGGNIKVPSEDFLNKLTGGNTGTASALIQTLIQKRTQLNDLAPPSEAQLNIMTEWYLCPDIPFESITVTSRNGSKEVTIERRKYLTHLSAWGTDWSVPEDVTNRPWRYMTQTEFKEQLKEKLTKKEAARLIDEYRGVFYEWKRTRITDAQIQQIRREEERQNQFYVPKEVTMAITPEGDIIEIKTTSAREDYEERGNEPISEYELRQMSYKEANDLIDQMKTEKQKFRGSYIDNNDSQQTFQEKHSSFNERNGTGLAHDTTVATVREYHALNNIMFALESIAGYTNEEIHDIIKESVLEGEDSRSTEAFQMISEFMLQTIDTKRGDLQKFKDLQRLFTICEESTIATEIAHQVAVQLFETKE